VIKEHREKAYFWTDIKYSWQWQIQRKKNLLCWSSVYTIPTKLSQNSNESFDWGEINSFECWVNKKYPDYG